MAYDYAGNLTADKDSYDYEYDYENRIVEILSGETSIAEFDYDALGRRISKYDAITETGTLYYYSNNWQVLEERDGSDAFKKWFAYGNYIDEVLLRNTSSDGKTNFSFYLRVYLHDHLFSPVAMMTSGGSIDERYEYDAYGNPTVMDSSYQPKTPANYKNNILFTGREVDILDSGSLTIQYNRNRYYDYYTGRWLTQDMIDYQNGMNLYQYVGSNPLHSNNHLGLIGFSVIGYPPWLQWGIRITDHLLDLSGIDWGTPKFCDWEYTSREEYEIPIPSFVQPDIDGQDCYTPLGTTQRSVGTVESRKEEHFGRCEGTEDEGKTGFRAYRTTLTISTIKYMCISSNEGGYKWKKYFESSLSEYKYEIKLIIVNYECKCSEYEPFRKGVIYL